MGVGRAARVGVPLRTLGLPRGGRASCFAEVAPRFCTGAAPGQPLLRPPRSTLLRVRTTARDADETSVARPAGSVDGISGPPSGVPAAPPLPAASAASAGATPTASVGSKRHIVPTASAQSQQQLPVAGIPGPPPPNPMPSKQPSAGHSASSPSVPTACRASVSSTGADLMAAPKMMEQRVGGVVVPPPPAPPALSGSIADVSDPSAAASASPRTPPTAQAQAPSTRSHTAGVADAPSSAGTGACIPPPPSMPQARSPDASRARAVASSTASDASKPLSAEEQYDKLKHMLPMTKAPDTPKPPPEELKEGLRLRVEWSNSYWAARVLEATEDKVKIGYDTWTADHDEWISRDSQRFWLPVPDHKDLAEEGLARPKEYESAVSSELTGNRRRNFVPQPYNPSREFQKRQMRLRQKIAAMQEAKLGVAESEPSEFWYKSPQVGAESLISSPPDVRQELPAAPPLVQPTLSAPQRTQPPTRTAEAATSKVERGASPSGAEDGAAAASSSASVVPIPPPPTSEPLHSPGTPLARAADVDRALEGDGSVQRVPPVAVPTSSVDVSPSGAEDGTAAVSSSASVSLPPPPTSEPLHSPGTPLGLLARAADVDRALEGDGSVQKVPPVAVPTSSADVSARASHAPAPAAAPSGSDSGMSTVAGQAPASGGTTPGRRSVVKWQECVTKDKERYYHEVATGRTQWELPADGWVELIADDGALYYWDADANVTQWTKPS